MAALDHVELTKKLWQFQASQKTAYGTSRTHVVNKKAKNFRNQKLKTKPKMKNKMKTKT